MKFCVSRRNFIDGASAFALSALPGCRIAGLETTNDDALAELQRQIDEGMIDGAVFQTTSMPYALSIGNRTFQPPIQPMTVDTRFDVASVTKPVVAACAALLYADGSFDPFVPVSRYLPELATPPACVATGFDLATHSSGFRYLLKDGHDEAAFWRAMLAHRPVAAPGTTFKYCCYNYVLLGHLVERISGKRLDRFAHDRLFVPLGMDHAAWGPVPPEGCVAFPHAREGFTLAPRGRVVDCLARNCAFPIGNAGLFATVDDMMRFVRDILERRRFPAAYYDLMTRRVWEKDGVRRSFGWDMRDEGRPARCSRQTIFHTGSTGQTILCDPANGFAAVLLTSRRCEHDAAILGRRRVMDALSGSLAN